MTAALFGLLLAATTKSSSSSGTFIIFLVLIAIVGYFLLLRPQKQKAKRQREQQSAIGVGDEIVTVGGIVGRVVAVDPERVTVVSGEETVGFAAHDSEPTRLVLVRNAIARKIEPVVIEPEPEPDGHDGYGALEYGVHDDDDHDQDHDGELSDDDRPPTGDGRSAESGGTGP